jgi:DNA-binding HxlR family transcriptional regulator
MQAQFATLEGMLGKTYDSEVCSAARALELVGERWSLLIIRNALFAGATRYNDFRTLDIATNILKNRLDTFVDAGIMQRRNYSRNPDHYEYLLTDKGRELATVIVALTEWGDRWAAPDGPPILYTHTVCGGPISLQTTCANCGLVHDAAQVQARPGPGMPADRAARMG